MTNGFRCTRERNNNRFVGDFRVVQTSHINDGSKRVFMTLEEIGTPGKKWNLRDRKRFEYCRNFNKRYKIHTAPYGPYLP